MLFCFRSRAAVAAGVAALVFVQPVQAATVSASAIFTSTVIADEPENSLVASVNETFDGPRTSGEASASANAVSGELKARSFMNNFGIFEFDGSVGAQASITETFSVRGAGTVSFLLDFEGFYEAARYVVTGNIMAETSGTATQVSDFGDNVIFRSSGRFGAEDFSETATLTYDFAGTEPSEITTTWAIRGVVEASTSFREALFDAGNTGYISIFASDGISITSSSENFLGGQFAGTPMTPVPLPAGGLLLLSGLGLCAFASRSKRTSALSESV